MIKSSSVTVPLQWALMWNLTIFTFWTCLERSIHIPFFQSSFSWPSGQTISYCTWSNVDPSFKPSLLLGMVNIQVWRSKFCPLGGFPFTTVLQGHSQVGLRCYCCSLSSGARMLCRTICKSGLYFFFLGQLIIENFLRGPRGKLRRRRSFSKNRGRGNLSPLPLQLICACRT